MRLVMLGGTGSGKGTQTAKLCDLYQIPSISMGNILRDGITSGTELGKQAQSYVEKGDLVPDQLIIQFIKERLLASDVKNGWILEGYPRTAFQAEELDFLLKKLEQKLDWAIYLKVSDAIMKERALSRALSDDTPEVIERRLATFKKSTIPLLEYYQYCNRLLTIDGKQSPEQVAAAISQQLKLDK